MNTETDTCTRRMHVKINAEIGMMHLQAKDYQKTPEVRREASNHFPLKLSDGTNLVSTLILDF